MKEKTSDVIAFMFLMLLTLLFASQFVNFNIKPIEDAAMLMRYADHLAQGHGIVWNIGEHPVDGATDFLFMVAVAFFRRIGFSLEVAVRSITISSHFITVAMVYFGMRKLQNAGIIPAFLSALYFAIGPGLFLSAAYFGTSFFVLAIVIAWILAQRLMFSDGWSILECVVFSLACLTVGLIRPEGVIISIFILIAIGIISSRVAFRRLVFVFGGIFLTLGGTYFVWRWNYFGYPLPNPFYKKGGGLLYDSGLKTSIVNSYQLLYLFIPSFLLSIRNKSVLRKGIAFLVPITGSIVMWVFLSEEMNFGARYQYPTLAIAVLSWFPLVKTLRDDLHLPRFSSLTRMQKFAIVLVAACILGFVFRKEELTNVDVYAKDGLFDVAVMLSDYADRGYTIATTEAGLLPLYSKWRAIDTWGLNDQWIAHNGLITEEYLQKQRPDIIMWHGHFSPLQPLSSKFNGTPWSRQVLVLQQYAEHQHFTLAAVYGIKPDDTHYYYVRSDIPDCKEIVNRIRSIEYRWEYHGGKCINYAELGNNEDYGGTHQVLPIEAHK